MIFETFCTFACHVFTGVAAFTFKFSKFLVVRIFCKKEHSTHQETIKKLSLSIFQSAFCHKTSKASHLCKHWLHTDSICQALSTTQKHIFPSNCTGWKLSGWSMISQMHKEWDWMQAICSQLQCKSFSVSLLQDNDQELRLFGPFFWQ